MPNHFTRLPYLVSWSDEDQAWVATVDGKYSSLSFISDSPHGALKGLVEIIEEVYEEARARDKTHND